MESDLEIKPQVDDTFPVIILDYELLGSVLTEFGRLYSHIKWNDHILVEDITLDDQEKVLTTFIRIVSETQH